MEELRKQIEELTFELCDCTQGCIKCDDSRDALLHLIKEREERMVINLGKHFNYEKHEGRWSINKDHIFNKHTSFGHQQVLEALDDAILAINEDEAKSSNYVKKNFGDVIKKMSEE